MYKGDLGNYFIKGSEIYHCISYINNPCVELKNIRTGEIKVVVCDSEVAKGYKKLYEGTNEKMVKPVTNITTNLLEN